MVRRIMNPNYFKTRLRAEIPEDGLPAAFAGITVCNPNGREVPPEENAERTRKFSEELVAEGHPHFPLTGYDPEGAHAEPGFGVACPLEVALGMGRRWEQEAIFWVEEGRVRLVSCKNPGDTHCLGEWAALADGEAVPSEQCRVSSAE